MISSERDFYSVSKPIFSYYCLKKKEEGGQGGVFISCITYPLLMQLAVKAAVSIFWLRFLVILKYAITIRQKLYSLKRE